ncbi:MAG: glutathione S-transferase family protein [Polyangiaceae bacterium]|nr:glutathione S-transferase family protein [Polyangiaceae bacterium]
MILHQFQISPFCDKIRRILHVKGLSYETREVPLSQLFTRLRKLNKVGKVPVLEHNGAMITDSTDIAHYLEERFPTPALLPTDRAERGLVHVLEDWADESLYFYEVFVRFGLAHNAAQWVPTLLEHDPKWFKAIAGTVIGPSLKQTLGAQGLGKKPVDRVLRDIERHVDALAGMLGERQWLVGSTLTLADIAVVSQLGCIGATPEGAAIINGSTPVSNWMTRVNSATKP